MNKSTQIIQTISAIINVSDDLGAIAILPRINGFKNFQIIEPVVVRATVA